MPLIVGRNSVNLKSIEEKTKTQIKFRAADDDNYQICTISGSANDVKNAKQLIDVETKKQPIITDELLVPMSSCGKIEGYCGSILHEICQRSSAKVWVDPGMRKTQGENRRVLITGTKEQVELAKKLIEEKIKEPTVEQSLLDTKDADKKSPRASVSPFASNSSITTTESPREVMLPSPEKLKNNGGPLEVYVSAVASPSRFWVQICGPQTTELDFLVDAMTEYYNQKENQELHAIREPYLGQIVAAMYLADNKWYRAEIVAIQPNSNDLILDVYLVDYGDQQFVGRKDILELRTDFLSLRFQAIECFLANVQPIHSGSSKFEEWDRKAIEKFESLVQVAQWKKMISKTVAYKERKSFALQRQSNNKRESSPIPGVELYEENSDRNIALELVESGYAEMSDRFGDLAKSSVLIVKDTTPEPKEILSDNKQTVKDAPTEVVEVPKEVVEDPKEMEEPKKVTPPAVPEKISSESNEIKSNEQSVESKKSEPQDEEEQTTPSQNDTSNKENKHKFLPSDNNSDAQTVTNGQSQKPQSNPFGGSNMKPIKSNKKKKQQATADFLKSEQEQNAAKKHKGDDWNAMMDDQ